jgi:hypothetical protein
MKFAAALIATLLLIAPRAGWAIASFTLNSSDLISTSSFTESETIGVLSGITFTTVTVGTVALALEIEDIKPSAQSPHHNLVIITNGVENTADVQSNAGITTTQQTAGGANVTMSLNNIIVGAGGLTSTTPSALPSNNPTVLLVGVLNQPFTVKNSYWFAQVLNVKLLVDAFIAGSASATNAIAENTMSAYVAEFSPHHNLGRSSTAVNVATVTANAGIVTVQQTAGFANVAESLNTLIVGTATIGSPVLVNP